MDTKRLPVLSDTHGNVRALEAALQWINRLQGTAGTAVFLGDGIRDLSRVSACFPAEWKTVRGNNDDTFTVPEAAVLDFCGHRFFLCHGHRHSLYGGFHTLVAAARTNEAEAVLFGHTHVPHYANDNGVLLVNPGSIGRPRSGTGPTFAVIECAPGTPLEARFFGIGPEGDIREIKW